MFRAVDQLSEDLHRFVADRTSITLPFAFANEDVGTAIIQIAAGKAPADLLQQSGASDEVSIDDLRSAAQHFVAKVMLATGSDLFTVLGVSSACELLAYRDNYRRLMAMVHPDARPTGFPTDAAIRVNHAYAVLSDPEQLENYKAQRESLRDDAPVAPSIGAGLRSQQSSRPASTLGFAGRIGALLFRARERGLLLWLALLLLVPVGGALYLTLSENPQARLVEARPKLGSSQAITVLAPPGSSSLAAPSTPVFRTNKAEKESPESTQNTGARRPPMEPSIRPIPPTATQTPALVFETSLSMARLATLVEPASATIATANPVAISTPSKGSASLAPTPNLADAQTRSAPNPDVEIVPTPPVNTAPLIAQAEPSVADKPPIATCSSPVRAPAAETRAPITTAVGTPVTFRLRSVDVEDVLMRFSNAYETGSLSGFDQVLAPGMPGRSQLLTDYGRVFQVTRNRSIRFIQLKHATAGERMATRGYAVVTTTDQENRVSKQRVYIEMEISIDRNVPRIERISNYVIN